MIREPMADQASAQTCFLCALDPAGQVCAVPKLEGLLIAAHETQIAGEMVPWVTLRTDERYVSITLTRPYRTLVQGLRALTGSLANYGLILRVYHLPPLVNITHHHGRSVERYRANDYTLAILAPDTILNITDLNQAEYCARQYLLGHLVPMGGSKATLRGNIVHHCFKELLKEQDRSRFKRSTLNHEEPLTILQRHLERELVQARLDLALLDASAEEMRAEAIPHLESLANWFEQQRTTLWDFPTEDEEDEEGARDYGHLVRAETFLMAPEIGLRGRLDLLWQQGGRRRLLELKTGGASGQLPRPAHKWQVQGYHALLAVRRESRMKKALATLLYSGTPQQAQSVGIPFTINQLQAVNALRNTLILSHATGMPPEPPSVSRCTKCAMQDQCGQVSALLGWQPPKLAQSDGTEDERESAVVAKPAPARGKRPPSLDMDTLTQEDRAFFALYYELLRKEGHEIERQQALLWQSPVKERVTRGSTISALTPVGEPESTEQGEWQQEFRCTNTSELREGDEILLSDGDPVTGEVVTGTILSISAEKVRVWTPELIARPSLLDRYDMSIVHVRTVQNVWRWLRVEARLRALVNGTQRPTFSQQESAPRPDFNDEQNLAVTRALQMHDYLLIHGPPGTGKTSVIAEIVKRLCQQGQRVLLAGFTNQAVDNMLARLAREGFHNFIRLGHERSVSEAVRPHLLQALSGAEVSRSAELREILQSSPVVAATTATWSSDKYEPSSPDAPRADALLAFDVALIDEAGQLTLPAGLGALRFAKRFILVGDEMQLPPLVLDKDAGTQGLADSLFGKLKRWDEAHCQMHQQEISACVPLRVQYRMHETISEFASRTFYQGELRAHFSVARRRLDLLKPLASLPRGNVAVLHAVRADLPMVFLDVRAEAEPVTGKLSDAEARMVRETIAQLLARGVPAEDIGVIAPYRAQVANLRRHLFRADPTIGWSPLPVDTPLSIDTVDRFQGGERSVMIISFATSVAPSIESQLYEHLTNPHRLNVALTRAQRKLILVGNAAALEKLDLFAKLLEYCRGLQAIFTC